MTWIVTSLQWYAVLILITWAFAPWARLLVPSLPDKAAFIARPLALLATVYPLWLLSSSLSVPYATAGLWVTVVLGAVGGWGLAWRCRRIDREWLRWLLVAEALALACFALYAAWRGYAPQIVNTEKPMDIAFLASTARATSMPPPDPWMSGEPINYYYLGYLLQGAISRMSNVVPTVGFNLALATTFSMTSTAAFGTAYVMVRRWASYRRSLVAGALALIFIVVGGNLYAAKEFVSEPARTVEATWWGGVGWNASRIVHDASLDQIENATGLVPPDPIETINEFPAFSFVLGDLHPHVLALPFTIVAVYLAFALYVFLSATPVWTLASGIRVLLVGGVVGSLYMLNSWDYPTYLLVAGVGVWLGARHLGSRVAVSALALLGVASIVLWLPFFATFTPPVGGNTDDLPRWLTGIPLISTLLTALGTMRWEHTSMSEFFTVFGVPFVVAVWFLAHGVTTPPSVSRDQARTVDTRSIGLFAVTILTFGLLLGAPVVVLCGIPLTLAALQHPARRANNSPATLLFSLGFALILGTEFFYIQDIFANRMNTLFKIYYQAWTLFGLAMAIGVLALWRDAGLGRTIDRRFSRPALAATIIVALLAVSVYPILSASHYRTVRGPVDWTGLDGMAFVGDLNSGELAAMRWVRDNANEDDVLLEALGCSYQVNGGLPTSGMSAFTGVPTVLGWPGHERQWHLGDESILQEQRRRAELVDQLFSIDGEELRAEFGITLIYVGPFERDGTPVCASAGPYDAVQNAEFPGPGWQVAFTEGDATIYERVPGTASAARENT